MPDSPAMSNAEVNEDSNQPEVDDESDADPDDAVLPQYGATTRRQKGGRS